MHIGSFSRSRDAGKKVYFFIFIRAASGGRTDMRSDSVIRLMLVDDHAVVRSGYKRFFELEQDLRVVAEASCGEDAYALLSRIDADLVMLDLEMPGQGGFETLRKIAIRYPKQKVLVFTLHENVSIARQALQRGACGYLTKRMAPERIVAAIRDACRGGTPLDPQVEADLQQAGRKPCAHDLLLPREFEVFLLLAAGQSVESIGSLLCMSLRTVHNYQAILRRKMGLPNQIAFRRYAIRHRLIADSL